MTSNSFYTEAELTKMKFKSVGENVLISKLSQFYNPSTISIGSNVRIDDFCILSGEVSIGSFVHIAAFCALYGSGGITICDFGGLSSRVTIFTSSDDYMGNALTNPCIPMEYRKIESGIFEMKKHSLIGAGSVVLPNSTLGEGAVVGALSLARGKIKEWSIYAGIPAEFMKERKRETISSFEEEMLGVGNS
jgi:dTDP-4-amino-4,6-dideoxy-D-glucose acyltransferase